VVNEAFESEEISNENLNSEGIDVYAENDEEATFAIDDDIDVVEKNEGNSDVDTQAVNGHGSPVKYANSNKRKRHTKKIQEVLEVGQYLAVQIVKKSLAPKHLC